MNVAQGDSGNDSESWNLSAVCPEVMQKKGERQINPHPQPPKAQIRNYEDSAVSNPGRSRNSEFFLLSEGS
jgi:hypothetical protein